MATGTGKTLVALWAAKAQISKSIQIFVPSLALARQIYEEWRDPAVKGNLRNSDWLIVCSDMSVVDGESIEENKVEAKAIVEAGGTVVMDPKSVNGFIRQSRNLPLVVISTYHSAAIVAKGLPRGFKFDIGIFDEAHKTAGAAGKLFSFALLDKQFPIKKRLFFTATPKRSTYKGKSSDAKLVYHMNDEKVYGPVFYELSFKHAVERGLVVDFEVVIAAIVMPDLSREDILADPLIALFAKTELVKKTANKYGVKKIFSFHENNTIARKAEEFYKRSARGFKIYQVDGTQDVRVRANTLDNFKDQKKAIVVNSRCLSEGVNVPACDAVAFLSARRSTVDVVQAVGRASRVHDQKERAYVILPVFLEPGDDLETAKNKSAFRDAMDTLLCLREYDEVLADTIRRMRDQVVLPSDLRSGSTTIDQKKIRFEVDGLIKKDLIAGVTLDEFCKAFEVMVLSESPMGPEDKVKTILELAAL